MNVPLDGITIAGIIFVATIVRASLGFGEALVGMSLLASFLPIKVAAPLIALAGTLTASVILVREWREVSVTAASLLGLSGFAGVPIGVWALGWLDDQLVKCFLGALVLSFAGWSLSQRFRLELKTDRWALGVGFVAGVLTGAYNTGGPPVVIFGTLRQWSPAKFRATLQSWAFLGGTWAIVCHAWENHLTSRVCSLFFWSIPGIMVACWIGRRLTSTLPQERFRKLVHWGLGALGCYLLIDAARST